jgi:hypothetical protein
MPRSGGAATPLRFQGMKEMEMSLLQGASDFADMARTQAASTGATKVANAEAKEQQLDNAKTGVFMQTISYIAKVIGNALTPPPHIQ